VTVIRSLPSPTTVRGVRSFIRMCSYYRRFIPIFSNIAVPIIALTKKSQWSGQCQKAFEYSKESLTIVPDTTKPYTLYCDASDNCIGACLTQPRDTSECLSGAVQNEKPIYYLSHKLSDTQTLLSAMEKEAYAIHYALQKLDHYLHDAEFTIKTDHKPLKYILESPMQNKKDTTLGFGNIWLQL